LIRFLIFWFRFQFSEKVLNSEFVDWFYLFFQSVSSFFGSISGIQKKLIILSSFFDQFPHIFGKFLVLRKNIWPFFGVLDQNFL